MTLIQHSLHQYVTHNELAHTDYPTLLQKVRHVLDSYSQAIDDAEAFRYHFGVLFRDHQITMSSAERLRRLLIQKREYVPSPAARLRAREQEQAARSQFSHENAGKEVAPLSSFPARELSL